MKKIFCVLLFLTASVFSQKNINNYKYIIVPNKFDFVQKSDQYQTSSLTKFLFNKYGFKAFFADEKLPSDLAVNRCLALTAVVKRESSLLATKGVIELRDCYNKVIFTSITGKSKFKEYKKAYHEVIRKSFKSIQNLNYNYNPEKKDVVNVKIQKDLVKEVSPKSIAKKPLKVLKNNSKLNLYAQAVANGYQLVDTKPEVVFKIIKTGIKDVFIIENKNGILYKSGEIWIAEYYNGGVKKVENYQVKF